MWLQALRRFIRGGHVLGRAFVMLDLYPASRAVFLLGAIESGLIHALRTPRTRTELIDELSVVRVQLLDGLLAEGLAWRELSLRAGHYHLRGRRARALASEGGDAYCAQIQECFKYHGAAYGSVGERMAGAALGNYLDETGAIVARSSRILEAPTLAFLDHCLAEARPSSLLDVGCGSGIYLRHASDELSNLQSVGIDVLPAAVALARLNVHEWSLTDRVEIRSGDILDEGEPLGGPFEMVTLFHNLYYFEADQRERLCARLRSLLTSEGNLIIVCYFQGRSRVATHFDNVLRNTAGNTPLPDLTNTVQLLEANGFSAAKPKRLVPREPLFGLVAKAA